MFPENCSVKQNIDILKKLNKKVLVCQNGFMIQTDIKEVGSPLKMIINRRIYMHYFIYLTGVLFSIIIKIPRCIEFEVFTTF